MLNDVRFLHVVIVLLAAFLVLAGTGIYIVSTNAAEQVRDSNVRACEKVNNPNRDISRANDEQFKGFILDAVATRRADGDHEAADKYQARADAIKPLIVPNCQELFPKP